jgi:hypothetical protein
MESAPLAQLAQPPKRVLKKVLKGVGITAALLLLVLIAGIAINTSMQHAAQKRIQRLSEIYTREVSIFDAVLVRNPGVAATTLWLECRVRNPSPALLVGVRVKVLIFDAEHRLIQTGYADLGGVDWDYGSLRVEPRGVTFAKTMVLGEQESSALPEQISWSYTIEKARFQDN